MNCDQSRCLSRVPLLRMNEPTFLLNACASLRVAQYVAYRFSADPEVKAGRARLVKASDPMERRALQTLLNRKRLECREH
jgi:hypothetical protein